jgi:phosphoribosylformylglycinamidine synthase
VQGGSVVKPLVGVANDGPSDAAVVRPVLASQRGVVVACGMNPHYGDFDTYHMAACAIDEALRNCVAVGADPGQVAILDNFCWGNTDRPETLGSLVRAALACHDLAVALGTPFISGKDSLNNEFRYADATGQRRSIAIPPSLLISALGQVDDVTKCVTMDLKEPGNRLFVVGSTKDELGGSHFSLVHGCTGGQVPRVDPALAKRTFEALHRAIQGGLVRACHDLSEGGLAVALAEMAFAGGYGVKIDLDRVPCELDRTKQTQAAAVLLFSESATRFICEVPPDSVAALEQVLADVPHADIGVVTSEGRVEIAAAAGPLRIAANIAHLKAAWQSPLDW